MDTVDFTTLGPLATGGDIAIIITDLADIMETMMLLPIGQL
jgi:hypothetical protein